MWQGSSTKMKVLDYVILMLILWVMHLGNISPLVPCCYMLYVAGTGASSIV